MNNPIKVSILMPVFNEEKYITEAINSIFSYDYIKLDNIEVELIIVDDKSTDSTYKILEKLSKKYSNIKLLENRTKGKNNALNEAFLTSTGDYICLMGGDDLLEPKTLSLRLNAIRIVQSKYENLVYSCCKIKTFSALKEYNGILIPKDPNKGSASGGAIMLTRTLADKIFPIPGSLPNEDNWIGYYLKFFDITRLEVSEIGLHYRIHKNNSHQRGLPFNDYREQMWARSKALLLFYSAHYEEFNKEQENLIIKHIFYITSIYNKEVLSILLSKKMSMRDKVKALIESLSTPYNLKKRFYKYIVGR